MNIRFTYSTREGETMLLLEIGNRRPTDQHEQLSQGQTSTHSFFSPIERAKADLITPTPSFSRLVVLFVPRFLLAFSAAALAITPSKKYAEAEDLNILFCQFSAVTSALIINMYGINYLFDELKHTDSVRLIMLLACALGIMSSLPVFFMQQLVNKSGSILSDLLALVITVGSVPMQILGFLEFFEHIYPKLQRFYLDYLSRNPSPSALHEIKVVDLFMQKLSSSLKHCILKNEIPNHLQTYANDELMRDLLLRHEEVESEPSKDSKLNKLGLIISGITGILLAETVNLSFIKATYISLTPHMLNSIAVFLTVCITFPSAILSAEFGFGAACAIYSSSLNTIGQLYKANNTYDILESIKPSVGIHRRGELISFMLALLIVSFSFAPSVQFNRDLFANSMSKQQLDMINFATIFGTLLFNTYVLNLISYNFLTLCIAYLGTPEAKEHAKFYKLSTSVLSGFEKMPNSSIVAGVENVLGLEVAEEEATVFSFRQNS